MNFLQGIAGTLELFHRSTLAFQQIVGETTDHPAVYNASTRRGTSSRSMREFLQTRTP